MKKILGLVLMIALTGCESMHMDPGFAKPFHLDLTPPEGPPNYQQGYVDGCKSGWSGYSTGFNKTFYSYYQDPAKVKDPVYYQVWKDAYAYCAAYGMMNQELGWQQIDGDGKAGAFAVLGRW